MFVGKKTALSLLTVGATCAGPAALVHADPISVSGPLIGAAGSNGVSSMGAYSGGYNNNATYYSAKSGSNAYASVSKSA